HTSEFRPGAAYHPPDGRVRLPCACAICLARTAGADVLALVPRYRWQSFPWRLSLQRSRSPYWHMLASCKRECKWEAELWLYYRGGLYLRCVEKRSAPHASSSSSALASCRSPVSKPSV